MVITELRTMALIKNKHNPLIFQGQEPFLIVAAVLWVKSYAQLLNGCHDNLIGIVFRKHTAHKSIGIGVLLHTTLLKFIEFLTGLFIEIFTIHHKQAFLNFGVVF